MTLSDGSITSRPAIIAAAARIFPAPKTPLMGQSVLPSKIDCTNAVSTAVTVRVCHQWPNGLEQGTFCFSQPFVRSRCARSTQGKSEQLHRRRRCEIFCLKAAWLYVSIVRAVALLSALTKQHTMQRFLYWWQLYTPR